MTARLVAALAVALLVLTGCGLGPQDEPQPLPPTTLPPTTGTAGEPADRSVVVYLADEKGRLRGVPVTAPPGPYVAAALTALLEVGTVAPPPTGLRTFVPRGTTLGRVVVYPDDLLVDLGPQFLTLTGPDQVLATAQVVFTATERRPSAGVRLSVDGRDVPVPTGDGALRAGPVARADYSSLAVQPAATP